MNNSKTCPQCGQIKDIEQFKLVFDKRSQKSYRQRKCRECVNQNLREWQRSNKDKVAKYARTWRSKNPDKERARQLNARPKQLARQKKKRDETREARLAATQLRRAEKRRINKEAAKTLPKKCSSCQISKSRDNFDKDASRWDGLQYKCRDCQSQLSKNWQLQNPKKIAEASARRRALIKQADIRLVTDKEIIRLLSFPCAYCGAKSQHIDHIIPIAKGGRHAIGNLTGACSACNFSKGAKFLMEWKRDKGT